MGVGEVFGVVGLVCLAAVAWIAGWQDRHAKGADADHRACRAAARVDGQRAHAMLIHERDLVDDAQRYAQVLERDNVQLRTQVLMLRRQVEGAGLRPRVEEDDTPPPVSRRTSRSA